MERLDKYENSFLLNVLFMRGIISQDANTFTLITHYRTSRYILCLNRLTNRHVSPNHFAGHPHQVQLRNSSNARRISPR